MNAKRPVAAIVLAAGKGTRMKSDLHKALLQLRQCAMLEERREDGYECPEIQDIASGLRDQSEILVGARACAVELRTSDYQLGSYAAGREILLVDIDQPLLALIKPEFRDEF